MLTLKRQASGMVALAAVIQTQAQSHGAPGWFGGYADGVTSLPTGKNGLGGTLRVVYDDLTFLLPGDITGFEIVGRDNTGSPVAMYYEIRTEISEGNGGNLLFSGNTPTAAAGPLPLNGTLGTPPPGSGPYRWYNGAPATPIHLEPGSYWVGLAPLQGFGSFDIASTQGLFSEGLPVNNGNAFYYDSSDPSQTFVSQGDTDFALRVVTSATVVPEPQTRVLLCLAGTVSLLARRRR